MTHPILAASHQGTELRAVAYDHPEALRLTQALHQEQLALYGFADTPDDTPTAHFAPPRGLFVIACVGSHPAVGCGGVRLLDAGTETAEIKRMYVTASARGHGLGRRILEFLEHYAAVYGATRLVLETGCRNEAALALYRDNGYQPLAPYVPGRNLAVNRALAKPLGARRSAP